MDHFKAVKFFSDVAKLAAKQSTCLRSKVGCVLTSTDHILLSTGYNGAPSGMKHCNELKKKPDAGTCNCVHAEQNAILWCKSTPREAKKAYLTLSPCLMCAKLLVAFGVKEIYYLEQYRIFDDVKRFCSLAKVSLINVGKIKF